MHPELITVTLPVFGRVTITSFGVMMALAFLSAYQVIRVQLKGLEHAEEIAGDILVGAVIGGIVGAKLYYVVLDWQRTLADPIGMLFSRAGLVWYGGLLGGALGVLYMLRRRGASIPRMADVCAPALALAYGIGRIGCFLVGDDYGRPTDSWIGVAFPKGSPPTTAGNLRRYFGVSVPPSVPDAKLLHVYPTELFETGMALIIFLVLWRLRKHPHRAGWLFGVWMVAAGIERLVIEIFRAKDDRFLGPFTVAQLISALLIAGGYYLMRRRERSGAPAASPAG